MTEYTIRWKINIEADSPKQAAQRALEIQRDNESTATVFEVYDSKDYQIIDLENG